MKENVLIDKSIIFAARIVKLHDYLIKNKKGLTIAKQIIRSGTSIGANAKECAFAQSKADFTAKMFIAQKECAETEYWLELLYESEYISKCEFDSIYVDCQELMRLIIASTKTLQNKK